MRLLSVLTVWLMSAAAATASSKFGAADIEAARYGSASPVAAAKRTPLDAKVQILLDRSGISPGVIDGFGGEMSRSALRAFERKNLLPVDGILDSESWNILSTFATTPVTQSYRISETDGANLVGAIPSDYAEKALMSSQGFTSIPEKLAERFHSSEEFLKFLNPGASFSVGEVITVPHPGSSQSGSVTKIVVDKSTRRVTAFDSAGSVIADYPATIGSRDTPSPDGQHIVTAVAVNPSYTYNPARNFQQGSNDQVLTISPGPNGPVGSIWIALSKPSYGIHGTATPERLFLNQSHGCVRLTNWDASELAHLVKLQTTTVVFSVGN